MDGQTWTDEKFWGHIMRGGVGGELFSSQIELKWVKIRQKFAYFTMGKFHVEICGGGGASPGGRGRGWGMSMSDHCQPPVRFHPFSLLN